jgi:hypothetical protein
MTQSSGSVFYLKACGRGHGLARGKTRLARAAALPASASFGQLSHYSPRLARAIAEPIGRTTQAMPTAVLGRETVRERRETIPENSVAEEEPGSDQTSLM